MNDTRNVTDELKGLEHSDIVQILDERGVELEVAVENLERDFNMGTIIRNANAFGVRKVYVIGRRQWNKRGAMMTDKYLDVVYYREIDDFVADMKKDSRDIIAIDNIDGSVKLSTTDIPKRCVMVFGSEGAGISRELANKAAKIVEIEQLGSTRSVNVGVASGIAMYAWLERHHLQ